MTYKLTNQMMTRGALKWPYNMSHFMIKQKNNQKHCLGVGQKHHPKVGQKTILVILDLLKSIGYRKSKWFFDPLSFWGTFSFEIPIWKTYNSNIGCWGRDRPSFSYYGIYFKKSISGFWLKGSWKCKQRRLEN